FSASSRCSQAKYFSQFRGCSFGTHVALRKTRGWHVRVPVAAGPRRGQNEGDSTPIAGFMTESKPTARARMAPAGLRFLAITSVGWGFNWPVTKYLLGELPPLTLRGVTGVIGALLLAALAQIGRASCRERV